MIVTLGQQYNVGEKPTVILYTSYIYRDPRTSNKTKTKNTTSLDYSSICYITRSINTIEWGSMKDIIYKAWMMQNDTTTVMMESCPITIITVHTFK